MHSWSLCSSYWSEQALGIWGMLALPAVLRSTSSLILLLHRCKIEGPGSHTPHSLLPTPVLQGPTKTLLDKNTTVRQPFHVSKLSRTKERGMSVSQMSTQQLPCAMLWVAPSDVCLNKSVLLTEENLQSPQKHLPGSLNHLVPRDIGKDVDVFTDLEMYI